MSENDLFSETSEEQETVQADPDKNYLEELVGEDRKFKTPEDLARSKYEADLFIEQLKRETREMREELQKRLSLEEFADQFSKRTQQQADSSSNESEREDQTTQEQRTPQDIEAFLEQKLTEREKSQKAQSNLNSVFSEMEKRYGSAANKAINERAKELGVNVQFLKGIAESSPKAFLDLFPQRQRDDFSPPPSEVNRPASSGSGAKKFKDYEKMRKENPREYYTPRVQMEMFEQAKRQGEGFYN